MRALKGLVIVMGVMIVAGLLVLGYGIVRKASDPGFRFFKPTAGPVPGAATAFGEVALDLGGCDVVETRPDGRRLYLRTGGACERPAIIVIDTATGAVLGTIGLVP